MRQTQRPSTPVPDAEEPAFPESDCLVTVDAVPAWKVLKVPRHPTEGASSLVEKDQQQPCTLPSCVKYKKRNFRKKRKAASTSNFLICEQFKGSETRPTTILRRKWSLQNLAFKKSFSFHKLSKSITVVSQAKTGKQFLPDDIIEAFLKYSHFTPLANFWLAKFPVSTLTHFPMQIMPTKYFLSQRN